MWDPFGDGRTSVRAAYANLSDQPVTNVVTPTASNPPLVTPLTFTGRDPARQRARGGRPRRARPQQRRRRLPQPAHPELEPQRPARAVAKHGRDARLLRLDGRLPARVAQRQPGRHRQRRAALPAPVQHQPDPARLGRRQHHRGDEPRQLALQGPVGHAQPTALERAAVQRLVHALEVEGHQLAQLAGRRGAGQHQHRGRLRASRTTTPRTATW